MEEFNADECDAVVLQLMKAICHQETPIAVGALIGALCMYGEAFPELRSAIGRSLLLTGGELICSTPLYMPQADNHPPTPTTLQ